MILLFFLSLGRLSKEKKSIDIVIRAFANGQRGKNSVLLIVGDGPAADGLKDLAKKLEIESQVIFVGFVDWQDTIKYYKLGDIFL
ncbi:MAG: glycosyltransferase [Clostridium sp.]|nr:MAG: glycosyltransferase [Clostridium sp.]